MAPDVRRGTFHDLPAITSALWDGSTVFVAILGSGLAEHECKNAWLAAASRGKGLSFQALEGVAGVIVPGLYGWAVGFITEGGSFIARQPSLGASGSNPCKALIIRQQTNAKLCMDQ